MPGPSDERTLKTSPSSGPRVGEVFRVSLRLGLTCFGGPIAHLAYFHEELVRRRKWVTEEEYADLVALCQFTPGPGSSKVGFALGLIRGQGIMGGIAAWAGFTLPSALILFLFALGASLMTGPLAQGAIHGLKLVAVSVVAEAVWKMALTLTPDLRRRVLAIAALALALVFDGAMGQMAAIGAGMLGGLLFCQRGSAPPALAMECPVRRRIGTIALALFGALLVVPPLFLSKGEAGVLAVFDAFYRSGALVFGGGHVLLPLLEAEVVQPGWVTPEAFLAGYGMTQAVPGPLFTFATYLGAVMEPVVNRFGGAALALFAVFLPGMLLTYGILPFWNHLRKHPNAQALLRGANAAVVGVLAAALYHPIWTGGVKDSIDVVLVAAGLALLVFGKRPAWQIVLLLTFAGIARAFFSL